MENAFLQVKMAIGVNVKVDIQADCSSKDEGIYKMHTETKQTLFIENNS
jgi:hypothetical protein